MGLKSKQEILADLPSVEEIMQSRPILDVVGLYPRSTVVDVVREVIAELRRSVLSSPDMWFPDDTIRKSRIVEESVSRVKVRMQPSLHGVINATGIVIHTNLGRAILPETAREQLWEVASRYSNLEVDMATGERGLRYSHVERLLCSLTGAEAAIVVNNNAAAVLLALASLAAGKEVVVSRGQLVEVGGSFRIPEVMEQSGCRLVEVGATNKTHPGDYERAITEQTGALLKVHTSNYRIVGFTAEVSSSELVEIGRKHQLPVMEDLGSGVLVDLSRYGLEHEPTVQETIKAGMDIVTISGDKLLGGPQAGIILGRREWIEKMRKHPLNRALRIDKLTLAALESTLKLYLDEEKAVEEIPVLRMLTIPLKTLALRAEKIWIDLTMAVGDLAEIKVRDDFSQVGGGSMPLEQLPTKVLTIVPKLITVDQLERRLREYMTPIFARINKEQLILDLRTIQDGELPTVSSALVHILTSQQEV